MSEVKDLENKTLSQAEPVLPDTAEKAVPTSQGVKGKWKNMPRQKRRRMIRRIIALVVVLAVVVGLIKVFGGKKTDDTQIVTDTVQYGSITSTVEGNGLTKAKKSETITLTTAGTVTDVMVTEGQKVTAGTPLFTVDSEAARTAVQKARKDVEGYEKQLNTLQKDIAGLNLAAGYPGKLMDVVTLNPGDTINKGDKVATLSDDTRLRLEQYYSYAYAGDIKVGQTVQVSIPSLMSTIPGTVEAVHMVSRITPEGSKLFSAEIVVKNEGALTADMAASATVTVNGETFARTLTVLPKDFGTVEVEPEPASTEAANTEFRNNIWPLYEQPVREKLWAGAFLCPAENYMTLVDFGQVKVTGGQQGSRSNSTRLYTIPGEPCRAPAGGVVVFAGNLALTGNTVVIDHGCGVRSYLYGLQELSVTRGQTVERGQAVGVLGEELTMDFKLGSKSVNPWPLFQTSGGLFWKENG